MRDALDKDYQAMAGMIFGEAPALNDVLASVEQLERSINAAQAQKAEAA